MKIITTGSTRFVILTKHYAIKIPRLNRWPNFLQGLLANLNEALIYRIACIQGSVLASYVTWLCPVVWSGLGGFILVMRRCQPIDEYRYSMIGDRLFTITTDHKIQNYGLLPSSGSRYQYRPVLLDYGTNVCQCVKWRAETLRARYRKKQR